MEIRNATIDDLNKIIKLENECFNEAEAASAESLKNRLLTYPDHFYVMYDNDRIIGMINGLVSDLEHLCDEMYDNSSMHNEDGKWQMIFGVDVASAYRNRGLASLLIKHLIDDAKKQHRLGAVLTCKNELISFYERFGFKDEGISDSEHGNVVWHEMRLTFND